MSRLEAIAHRALTPMILGNPSIVAADDAPAITAWLHKTALVGMLVSSEQDRERGHGVPPNEYRQLYELRDTLQPLPATQSWIGRYTGARMTSIRVIPIVVAVTGMTEPDQPTGYAMTIVLGELLLHGARFTTPSLQIELTTELGLQQLWPIEGEIRWPAGPVVTDDTFFPLVNGEQLASTEPPLGIRPWTPATELTRSRLMNGMVELPAACGEHVMYYPAALAVDGTHGRRCVFITSCDCGKAYLVQAEEDGAHCKAAGSAETINALYGGLDGEEYAIEDGSGTFVYKQRPSTL